MRIEYHENVGLKRLQINPLTVPELLELILSFASQSELVKSAIVCKFWSMLALDRLWKDLDSVFPLLELVVTRELLNVLDSSDADFVQRLSLALSRSDWSRFRSYANRVRSLSHDDTNHYRGNETPPCLTSVATALIYLHHPYGNFLPNIKELQWASSRSATSMVPFLSPELETLVIDLSGDSQSINELLNGLTWRTPKLKSFSFATSTPAIAVETSLQRAIRAWIELEDLAIPQYYLRPTILDVAAALPNLTALKQDYSSAPPTDETVTLQSLPPNAFPVLHTFGFNTQPAAAIRLIHQSERLFSRLTFLHINAVEGIGNAEILQLSRHIGEQCKQLNRLGFDLSLPPRFLVQGTSPLSFGVIENLFPCTKLQTLQICHPFPIILDATNVEVMAAAWPALTKLVITEDIDLSLAIPDGHGNSLSLLSTFARYLPRLKGLGLYFSAVDDISFSGDLYPPYEFQELMTFWVGVSAGPGRPLDAAFLIASLCKTEPSLITGVSFWYAGVELPSKWEERENHWDTVSEHLELAMRTKIHGRHRLS